MESLAGRLGFQPGPSRESARGMNPVLARELERTGDGGEPPPPSGPLCLAVLQGDL